MDLLIHKGLGEYFFQHVGNTSRQRLFWCLGGWIGNRGRGCQGIWLGCSRRQLQDPTYLADIQTCRYLPGISAAITHHRALRPLAFVSRSSSLPGETNLLPRNVTVAPSVNSTSAALPVQDHISTLFYPLRLSHLSFESVIFSLAVTS